MERLEEFDPQEMANAAWVPATRGVRQEELLGAIAGRASVRLEEFSPESLAGMVWALSRGTYGRVCDGLLGEGRRQGEDPYAICGVMWAPTAACECARQAANALLWLASWGTKQTDFAIGTSGVPLRQWHAVRLSVVGCARRIC